MAANESGLHNRTLRQVSGLLRDGQVSSVELTEAMLARIEAVDPAIRAFITVTPDLALDHARRADEMIAHWRNGTIDTLHPLAGVPLAIKDVILVEGVPATCGSRILENFRPPFSATVIEKLLAAGVVILGKTNTDEFAMGSSTENSAFFTTRNPWDTTRVPGGSSGGSAAAVAARMAFGALGSDTGGSIRQPASLCGVVGIKPSYGRVSRYGLVAFASSLDQIGPLARTVGDAALILGTIAGHDPKDSTAMRLAMPDCYHRFEYATDLKGLRVGVPKEYFIEGMQSEVETAVRDAVKVMESLGAEAREVSLPHTEYALPVYYLIAPAEASANLARYDGVRYGLRVGGEGLGVRDEGLWDEYRNTRGVGFGAEVKRRIMIGTYALSSGYYDAYYLRAQKVRTLIKGDFDAAFKEVDVIACPVTPTTAFKIGEKADNPLEMYLSDVFTLPANLAGICGISLPCGFDTAGLPIGLQLMGPAFGEERILKVAAAYEAVTGWHTRPPGV
ncbi:MAG: Asp-tRNA(Asn)/Glu-tRNA(Gln) amidotransferase subunit GatA [Chloroflexi bacterium]|nr:Asp-tRNA(Asn)/Glu-tRNA(Gln) amidotransferase subunit GatA [Chloroflexota bacterium]